MDPNLILRSEAHKRYTGAGDTDVSKTMLKDKFCKLENRIFLRGCRKLFPNFIMNIRSTISRICLIQSLIFGWFRL
jgi:hypothetical protein